MSDPKSKTTISDLLDGGWYRVHAAKEWRHPEVEGFHTLTEAVNLYMDGVKYGNHKMS